MFLMLLSWMCTILLIMFASIYNLDASILLPTMFMTLLLSNNYPEDVVSEESLFCCSRSSEVLLIVVTLITLVSLDRQTVYDLGLTIYWCFNQNVQ